MGAWGGQKSGGGTGGSQSIKRKQTKVTLGWEEAHGGVGSVEGNWKSDKLAVDLNQGRN